MKELNKEQIELLKKPIDQKALNPHPTKSYLTSIKAIYVTERLTEVFGVGGWTTKVEEVSCNVGNGMVVVKVTLECPEYGVYYESYGGNDNGGSTNKNFDLGDAYKGATTDAITKIGSYLGIAIDVFKGESSVPKKQDSPKITEWLSHERFTKYMQEANAEQIQKLLDTYDGSNGKGMKKEYREQLKTAQKS